MLYERANRAPPGYVLCIGISFPMADHSDESFTDEEKKPGRACEGSRQDLIKCLRESDCVKVVCQ